MMMMRHHCRGCNFYKEGEGWIWGLGFFEVGEGVMGAGGGKGKGWRGLRQRRRDKGIRKVWEKIESRRERRCEGGVWGIVPR